MAQKWQLHIFFHYIIFNVKQSRDDKRQKHTKSVSNEIRSHTGAIQIHHYSNNIIRVETQWTKREAAIVKNQIMIHFRKQTAICSWSFKTRKVNKSVFIIIRSHTGAIQTHHISSRNLPNPMQDKLKSNCNWRFFKYIIFGLKMTTSYLLSLHYL